MLLPGGIRSKQIEPDRSRSRTKSNIALVVLLVNSRKDIKIVTAAKIGSYLTLGTSALYSRIYEPMLQLYIELVREVELVTARFPLVVNWT